MSEHITPLTLIALIAVLSLAILAVSNWLEYRSQKRRYHSLKNAADELCLKLQGRGSAYNHLEYNALVQTIQKMTLPDAAPWLSALKWIIPRYSTRDSGKVQLNDVIMVHYQPLMRKVQWLKSIAPSTGLLFTVLGLMAVFFKQSQGLDHRQMLGDIGIALFTTAFSSLVLILQITILEKLQNLVEQEFRTGMALINQFFDKDEFFRQERRRSHVVKYKQ
ncbi:MotA/TolQ/ExbB proton channel family protein [Desulfocicer vacuolatum DSM 3385]|uniref:MotA/TolQ/ExbB proton channel family protein n=1 Tax=Desulfocicer vacuolatum DSM 3385 TaxID=1121400 RepID=A0A1W2ETK5_9BACT|nr:MotA/TolQ/ExbB proton channel family protein [Desulfocicer vacuolatum]SMD13043.1 MotA/TolQ/ExbB proton channel family protein [Desulfocicer vacuolatum DSM 3385]